MHHPTLPQYGLSPESENLRYRLGVDRPANPLDSTSTGTLHPDIFRVLSQDKFAYEVLDPAHSETISWLRKHLSGGDAALILIARRENGNLHWIMTDGFDGADLRIVDSLHESAYTEPLGEFLRDFVLSIITIKPNSNSMPPKTDPYSDGLDELKRVRKRIKHRQTER